MSSPPLPPGSAGSPYRISPARICSIAFTVFTLTIAYCSYIDYCVLQPVYFAKSEIQVAQSRDPASPNPVRAEIEFISSPDVMSPIVTDLQESGQAHLQVVPRRLAHAGRPRVLQVYHSDPAGAGTNIVTIRVASDLPKEASDLANAIANRYQTEREKATTKSSRGRSRSLATKSPSSRKSSTNNRPPSRRSALNQGAAT